MLVALFFCASHRCTSIVMMLASAPITTIRPKPTMISPKSSWKPLLLMRPASVVLGVRGLRPPEFLAGLLFASRQAIGREPAASTVDQSIHPLALAGRMGAVDNLCACAATKEHQHRCENCISHNVSIRLIRAKLLSIADVPQAGRAVGGKVMRPRWDVRTRLAAQQKGRAHCVAPDIQSS